MALGLGFMAGPVFGSFLYSATSYQTTFYVLSGVIFCGGILVFFFVPNSLNHVTENENKISARSTLISMGMAPSFIEGDEQLQPRKRFKKKAQD